MQLASDYKLKVWSLHSIDLLFVFLSARLISKWIIKSKAFYQWLTFALLGNINLENKRHGTEQPPAYTEGQAKQDLAFSIKK